MFACSLDIQHAMRIRLVAIMWPVWLYNIFPHYRGADKSLARPISRCILFDGENISFDASLVIYIVLIFLQL
jgi:hypothetical protein